MFLLASPDNFQGGLSSRDELRRQDDSETHVSLRAAPDGETPDLIYFLSPSPLDDSSPSPSPHLGAPTNMGRYKLTEEQLTSLTDHYIELGRKLEQEEHEIALYCYRSKLAAARKKYDDEVLLKKRYRQENELLRSQLVDVKDQLFALQVAHEELTIAHAEATSRDQQYPQESSSEDEYESSEPATASSEDEEYSDSDDDFDVYQQVRVMDGSDESDSRTHFLHHDEDESPFLPPGAPISVFGISFAADADDSSDADVQAASKDLHISQIQSFISKAHGGDVTARRRIQSLIRDAEKTAKAQRSPAHLYLLQTWRRRPPVKRPPLLTSSSSSSSQSSDSDTDSEPNVPLSDSSASFIRPWSKTQHPQPEIFVDASEYGIGFVIDDRWLAWKFIRGHKSLPLGSNGHLVMSWAEIVAVEMGVRALIAAGYQDTTIVVRSDNEGVVQALTRLSWTTNHGLFTVLERIYKLCRRSKLKLKAKWVSTKVNLADGPSRGVYSTRTQLFPFDPVVPEHFMGMIEGVD